MLPTPACRLATVQRAYTAAEAVDPCVRDLRSHAAAPALVRQWSVRTRSERLRPGGMRAEATSGDLDDAGYAAARGEASRLAHAALDGTLTGNGLDAVVALSGGPAWLTDHVLGDYQGLSTAGPAAVCGYPSISVPAGRVAGLPVGVTFMGPAWSEPRLLALAFAFEQVAGLAP